MFFDMDLINSYDKIALTPWNSDVGYIEILSDFASATLGIFFRMGFRAAHP